MITEILGTGRANARTAKELAFALGVNTRDITEQIERERKAGKPICSECSGDNPGYFIPECREEMERFLRSLGHRLKQIQGTYTAQQETLAQLPARGTSI